MEITEPEEEEIWSWEGRYDIEKEMEEWEEGKQQKRKEYEDEKEEYDIEQ